MQLLLKTVWFLLTSIYSVHFTTIDGADSSFAAFKGKKILLVNISTGSPYASQLSKLQQLYARYQDSVVIVAFPSNSFGTEIRSNSGIKQFCQDTYHNTFIIAAKGEVAGTTRQAIYNWLANSNDNAAADILIVGDFQKILISGSGDIIGIFAPEVDPMSEAVTTAIENN